MGGIGSGFKGNSQTQRAREREREREQERATSLTTPTRIPALPAPSPRQVPGPQYLSLRLGATDSPIVAQIDCQVSFVLQIRLGLCTAKATMEIGPPKHVTSQTRP